MRKVVDANYMQDPLLDEWLAASKKNIAVLTDYSAMEMYKGNTLISTFRTMAVLSRYPEQVVVLKGTSTVCRLKSNGAGMIRRMIDDSQSREFKTYCIRIEMARHGERQLEQQIIDHGAAAKGHMESVLRDAESMRDFILELAKDYDKEELAEFRSGKVISTGLMRKFVQQVMRLAGLLYRRHLPKSRLPSFEELKYSFFFRNSLCMLLLGIWWVTHGGALAARGDRIRNDMVDMNYVAFATYFDGLLTKDEKAKEIYVKARSLLHEIFG